MEVCLFVCLIVTYRCPNCWTERDEIWHGCGDGTQRFVGGYDQATPHPVGVTGRGPRMLFSGKAVNKKMSGEQIERVRIRFIYH